MNELEENEEFEVENIVDQRKNAESIIEYKIRWKGFSSDYDTWEPEANLIGCEEVLKEFKLNNGLLDDVKKDFEDGEVSESDFSDSDIDGTVHRKSKKSSKGKKRKSKKRNSSKAENLNVKGEFQPPPDPQTFNEDFGIKIEIAVDSQESEKKKSQSSFAPNFSMGASELLLNYYSMTMPQMEVAPNFKQEIVDLTDDVVVVKEEKAGIEYLEEPHSDNTDSDSDLEGQLKVVINDEQDTPSDRNPDEELEPVSQSEKARSWREQLDTVNFKIRKSHRKDDNCILGNEEAAPVLAKDKWTVKLKDNQTEAFYNLPVVQTLQEARLKIDKEIISIRSTMSSSSKDDIIKAIEEGNSTAIWNTLLCKDGNNDSSLNDGEMLILASRLGYADIIGMIIRAGVDVNYQNEEGSTPLMTACEFGHEIVCQLLIMNGAHINFTNKKFESALSKAVTRGHKECLVVLLQHGCDIFSIDNDKAPLQISRQRNLHEIEVIITEYHKKLSDSLTSKFINLMNSMVTSSYVLFPLRILSLYEEKDFVLEFNAKIPPVKEDECNLLSIFTGVVQDKQIQVGLEPITAIKSVTLNDIEQQSLIPDNANYVMSMSPIVDGKNVLNVSFESTINCRWARMLLIGFRVKINPNKIAV